jgi:hypothetical protein
MNTSPRETLSPVSAQSSLRRTMNVWESVEMSAFYGVVTRSAASAMRAPVRVLALAAAANP